MPDHVNRNLHVFNRPTQNLRELLKLARFKQVKVIVNNLLGHSVASSSRIKLKQEALR
jgi:hypothetical protein